MIIRFLVFDHSVPIPNDTLQLITENTKYAVYCLYATSTFIATTEVHIQQLTCCIICAIISEKVTAFPLHHLECDHQQNRVITYTIR